MSDLVKNEKKIFSGVDLFKLIASILIVLLHTVETTSWYPCEVKFVLTRFAVPFFFITSGFFLYRGLHSAEDSKRYFIGYEKKLLKLYAVWALVIYLPFEIVSYTRLYSGESAIKIFLIICRRMFIIGPGPYWYLVALMCSALFLYICYKRNSTFAVAMGIIAGLLLEIGYSCFRGFLSNNIVFKSIFDLTYFIFSWEYNFLMFGIPFMGIGYLIARYNLKISRNMSIIIFVLSTIGRIVEYNLPLLFQSDFWEQNNISFCFIFQAVSFFMLANNLNPQFEKHTSIAIRQLSSCIYFSHAIVLYEFLNPILDHYTALDTYGSSMIIPKMIIVILICCILFYIIKKINNKHLNILING